MIAHCNADHLLLHVLPDGLALARRAGTTHGSARIGFWTRSIDSYPISGLLKRARDRGERVAPRRSALPPGEEYRPIRPRWLKEPPPARR